MKAEILFQELKNLEEKVSITFNKLVALRDFDFTAMVLDNASSIEEAVRWQAITDIGVANELPILLICPKHCIIPFDVYVLKITKSEIITRCLEQTDEYIITFNEIANTWVRVELINELQNL